MPSSMGGRIQTQLDDAQPTVSERVVGTRGAGKETVPKEQPMLVMPVECYSRVVGYLRPISNWNKGKVQEFTERVDYKLPSTITEQP